MSLITATEVSTIAFVKTLDPTLILPMFISSAESKYIVPIVTTDLITDIQANPGNYTTLVNDYIKPYLAFCVKYMFYNQLLTETDTFPPDAQRSDALQEVLNLMEINRERLLAYLNENILTMPENSSRKLISGFRITIKHE